MDHARELQTWADWLGDDPKGRTIYAEIVEMLYFRQVWNGFALIHDSAPEQARVNATFSHWVRLNYARSMGSAIRRQVDVRDDVISLGRLIDHVWKYPTVLTREHYRATQRRNNTEWPDELSDRDFTSLAGDGIYINPEIPADDFRELQERTQAVRTWVNKDVAHYDLREREAPPIPGINEALDAVFDLLKKYYVLIWGRSVMRGVIMGIPPWAVVFRVPWIPKESWKEVNRQIHELELEIEQR